MNLDYLKSVDREVYDSIRKEHIRQQEGLELIASENYVSFAVLQTVGSVLTNKYAEGYAGKRYYGGCQYVDEVERLAIDRVRQLFLCDSVGSAKRSVGQPDNYHTGEYAANVQPHSGAQANFAVMLATLKPGDRFLGMALSDGGHLTHGHKATVSGKWFEAHSYGVDENGTINYDVVQSIAKECQPKLIIAGASAYPRIIDFARFRAIADSVGAILMVDMAHIAGLVAAGVHPSPVGWADYITSTNHKTLRGPRGGFVLCKSNYEKAMNSAVFPGAQGGPLMHVIAGKAVAFGEALQPEFVQYQKQVVANSKALAARLMQRGIQLVSKGTDNHLLLIDLSSLDLTGADVEKMLGSAHITANKNSVPKDKKSAMLSSGIRIGAAAVTSRGMKEEEMTMIADWVAEIVVYGESVIDRIGKEVKELCSRF